MDSTTRQQPLTISRRTFVGATGFLLLLRTLPRSTVEAAFAAPAPFRFFDHHQAAVVTEATARLIPGPADDPAEEGHPGAREAGVVHYIDLMLSAFDDDPPRIFAGGPWSDRRGGDRNRLEQFVPLTRRQEELWRGRIASLQRRYRDGVEKLDAAAGGDFTAVLPARQDAILLAEKEPRRLLFEHAIEGMYAVPEYGGNRRLAGWGDIGFAGDVAPRGWTAAEVTGSQSDPAPAGARLPFPTTVKEAGCVRPADLGTPLERDGATEAIGDLDAFLGAALPLLVGRRSA